MKTSLEIKVYYEDTDSLGVVYYANYLKYFERGRSEMVESLGKPIGEWNEEGFLVVVYKMNITFHRPARLGDICEVRTEILPSRSDYRLMLRQRLMRDDDLLTDAEVVLVCLDHDFELRAFPEPLAEVMRAVGDEPH